MADIPLFQQCRDHRNSCKQCDTALIDEASIGYGQRRTCIPNSRLAFPKMCAVGVEIWKARHEEMRTVGV